MAITAVLLAILIPINLLDSRPRTIEIGFNQNSDNGFARPYETQFETMIRTDTKAEKLKNWKYSMGITIPPIGTRLLSQKSRHLFYP